jgi:hypothetical protein
MEILIKLLHRVTCLGVQIKVYWGDLQFFSLMFSYGRTLAEYF